MRRQRLVRRIAFAGSFILLATGIAGCGTSGGSKAEAGAGADASEAYTVRSKATLADALPKALQKKGKIVWGVEPYFPPFQMTGDNNKRLVGLDIDLGKEISALLGVEAVFADSKFDAMIPGIQSGRFDAFIDAATDTAERRAEVNFVDYFQGGSAIFVTPGTSNDIEEMADLCGLKVGVVKGTFQVTDAQAQRDKCADGGKDALAIQVYPDQSGMLLALSSGRADAMLMDSAAGSFAAKNSNGKFESTGSITSPKRKGIVVSKENEELMSAIQKAVQTLMDNGIYQDILQDWAQKDGAIDKATINDGHGH